MLDPSALKSFNVLVATPCYGGSLNFRYVSSIIRLIGSASQAGMALEFFFRAGDSLVTRARNDCVAHFLSNPQFTHLFWIDADIAFSPESAMRLLLADRDVAAGVYPLKRMDWPSEGLPQGMTEEQFLRTAARYPVNVGGKPGKPLELRVDEDGFLPVDDAPTGFMVIKRSVFDLLIDKYPDYKYVPDWPKGSVPDGEVFYRFFDTAIDPKSRRLLSEDYAFCRLLQNVGRQVYVDANSNLLHVGQLDYSGDFGGSLSSTPETAIGAAEDAKITVSGLEYLNPNPLP